MLLSELLNAVEEKHLDDFRDVEVTGLAYDSRGLEKGQAFFCIKGLVTDGHLFAGDAARSGASAIFIEKEPEAEISGPVIVKVPDTRVALAECSARFYAYPSTRLKLVGVTGTNGKTTTTYLVENICRKAGLKTGLIGTVENHVLDDVEPVSRTTPESLDLQRLLHRMADAGVEVTVMEVSSHALELHRVTGCRFTDVVFTNLTQDHLDFHITLDEYFGAKKKLFEGEYFGRDRTAVLNVDDEFGRSLLSETRLDAVSYSIERDADVTARDVRVTAKGNTFNIHRGPETLEIATLLQGRFNVYNCLAAASVAFELGFDPASIAEGLETLVGVPGRFERIDCGQDFTVIVDYAHTPDGIRNLLEACREVAEKRVIMVVGCGGDRDRSKRPLMGRVAARMSDLCVVTSDNPRGEDPSRIIEMILEGIRDDFPRERYVVEVDRRKAIERAIAEAERGDLVVVAGKGHESGQIFADKVIPFDDRDVVRESLREVGREER